MRTRHQNAESAALRPVVYASMAGTVAEWYEFFLYATASTLVFGPLFFPKAGDPLDGVISALLVYAVGFLARPLGGLGPRMVRRAVGAEVRSRLDIFVKDLGIVEHLAAGARVLVPLAAAAHQLFLMGERAGLGACDDSSVVALLSSPDQT